MMQAVSLLHVLVGHALHLGQHVLDHFLAWLHLSVLQWVKGDDFDHS
jgi:hypothetical protein